MKLTYENLRTGMWWLYGSAMHVKRGQALLPDGRENYDEPVNYNEYKGAKKRTRAYATHEPKSKWDLGKVPKDFKPVALQTYLED